MQRDRNFASYEDPEARYDLRPSAWVEPVGAWGPGRVELMQFHTPNETNDNIVAYWVPEQLPPARRAARLRLSTALAGRANRAAAARSVGHAVARRPRLSRARRRRASIHGGFRRAVARGVTGGCQVKSRGLRTRERRDPRDERLLPRRHRRVAHDGLGQATRRLRSPWSSEAIFRTAPTSSRRRGVTSCPRADTAPRASPPLHRTTPFFGFLCARPCNKDTGRRVFTGVHSNELERFRENACRPYARHPVVPRQCCGIRCRNGRCDAGEGAPGRHRGDRGHRAAPVGATLGRSRADL